MTSNWPHSDTVEWSRCLIGQLTVYVGQHELQLLPWDMAGLWPCFWPQRDPCVTLLWPSCQLKLWKLCIVTIMWPRFDFTVILVCNPVVISADVLRYGWTLILFLSPPWPQCDLALTSLCPQIVSACVVATLWICESTVTTVWPCLDPVTSNRALCCCQYLTLLWPLRDPTMTLLWP